MESCPYLSRVSKDRGVLQERQQISQRERAADQRKLSAHLLLVERRRGGKEKSSSSGGTRELVPGSLSWRSTSHREQQLIR